MKRTVLGFLLGVVGLVAGSAQAAAKTCMKTRNRIHPMRSKLRRLALALPMLALTSLISSNAIAQNLVSDPGFESGTPSTAYLAGSTALPGWTVDSTPSDGVQLYKASILGATQPGDTLVLQLTGGSAYAGGGGVRQTIATTSGVTYTISIDVANRQNGSVTGNFSFGGQTQTLSASSKTFTTLAWFVTASSASTLLDITGSTSSASAQLLIDNVSVTPSTLEAVDAGTSTVAVSPASVGADGSSTAAVTVTLRDANMLPVPGKTVTLTSSRGATDTISAASGPSSVSGVVTFTVTSTTLGTAVFSATDVTDSNLAITQTASVNFVSLVIGGQQFSAGDVLPSPIFPESNDLLETSVSSYPGEFASQKPRNGTTGTAMENSAQNPANTELSAVTYNLNLTDSPLGYDITEIRLFSGWSDGRAGQSYTISYSLAAAPSTFFDLGTVSALTTAEGSLLTRTYDLTGAKILKGVAGLRFTMINNGYAGSGTVFREFDVLGSATPPKGTMIRIF